MSSQVLHRIFGALQTLEHSIHVCKSTLDKNKQIPKRITTAVSEQERLVRQMRRTANKLQVEIAKKNWQLAYRYLNIFYALNQMVRPEVIATFRELSGLPKTQHRSHPNYDNQQVGVYH